MVTQTLIAISQSDKRRLAGLEETIQSGLDSFIQVGRALAEIREHQYYRGENSTFEEYCHKRWRFTASRARQLIGSVEAIKNVEGVTTVTPDNERQARILASLDTQQTQAHVWSKAVETAPKDSNGKPKVTAAHVKKVADQITGKAKPPDPEPEEDDEPEPPPKRPEPNTIGELKDEIADWLNEKLSGKPPHVLIVVADWLREFADGIGN